MKSKRMPLVEPHISSRQSTEGKQYTPPSPPKGKKYKSHPGKQRARFSKVKP